MQSILSTDYYVHFEERGFKELEAYLEDVFHSKLFILVDSNTRKYCLPLFLELMDDKHQFDVIEIPSGEEHKHIDTCTQIWNTLTEKKADRKSLLINIGGGVITDMGGFVASTFKRGIDFINIPTTLLSMVDASVGGKTGVDLGVLKNQIGLFCNPKMVLIHTEFLNTVSEREIRSGIAEILKYGITFDVKLLKTIKDFKGIDYKLVSELIHRSVQIKNDVVLKDPKEQNIRKTLNFGHTIGHAIESYFLDNDNKTPLTHGEAIAVGMVVELYFSSKLFEFPLEETDTLKQFTHNFYGKIELKEEDFDKISKLMIYDKKNVNGKVNFVLMKQLEECVIDVKVADSMFIEGLQYYMK